MIKIKDFFFPQKKKKVDSKLYVMNVYILPPKKPRLKKADMF